MSESRDVAPPSAVVSRDHRLRDALVATLVGAGVLDHEPLTNAFHRVPRHVFLPDVPIDAVYSDRGFDLRRGQGGLTSASTPPSMMAIMLQQLGVVPGHRVLEIGTGSGYNAALLATLAGPGGQVTSVECDPSLVEAAQAGLASSGHPGVVVVSADGAAGEPGRAPYDRIIVTACAGDIATAWWDQLADGGRIVVPLVLRQTQTSVAFERKGDRLESVSTACCSFVPLRGGDAGAARWTRRVPLGEVTGMVVELAADQTIDVEGLTDALCEPGRDRATGVTLTVGEYLFGLRLWLELEDPRFAWLAADDTALGSILVPPLVRLGGTTSTGVVYDPADGLAALVRPMDTGSAPDDVHTVRDGMPAFELHVRQGGTRRAAASRLVQLVRAWDIAHRPFRGLSAALTVRAHRRPARPPRGRLVVERDCSRFALDW